MFFLQGIGLQLLPTQWKGYYMILLNFARKFWEWVLNDSGWSMYRLHLVHRSIHDQNLYSQSHVLGLIDYRKHVSRSSFFLICIYKNHSWEFWRCLWAWSICWTIFRTESDEVSLRLVICSVFSRIYILLKLLDNGRRTALRDVLFRRTSQTDGHVIFLGKLE